EESAVEHDARRIAMAPLDGELPVIDEVAHVSVKQFARFRLWSGRGQKPAFAGDVNPTPPAVSGGDALLLIIISISYQPAPRVPGLPAITPGPGAIRPSQPVPCDVTPEFSRSAAAAVRPT